MVWLAMGSRNMTDKEMMNRFLFGGRVTYQGNHYHVLEVNHLKNTYTLELQHGSERVTDVKASECEPYD
mgnify:FL=1